MWRMSRKRVFANQPKSIRTQGEDVSGAVVFTHAHEVSFELYSKLLVSPLITPIVVPYITPYITPFKEFRLWLI